jgi:hypothetical protein
MDRNRIEWDAISDLPTPYLRIWMEGQSPDAGYYQLAKKELSRRETQRAWATWGLLTGLAALMLFLSLHGR